MKTTTIILAFALVLLSGCVISNKKAYYSHTQEFFDKEKEFAISADSATRICADYRFKKESADTINTYLYLIYKDNYIFADQSRFYNPKTAWYHLAGVWVNAKTGKAKRVKGEKYVELEVVGDPFSYRLKYYHKQFIRKQQNK